MAPLDSSRFALVASAAGLRRTVGLVVFTQIGFLSACSPEAVRVRDGGPGADPGNTPRLAVEPPRANPQPADTSLWPGKAMAPVDRLARGDTLPHS
ncbi:MAG TPA: hypothetical protein VNV25_04920 [Gemmatimonadaceae bacterium]|jgi:hypothetical protein|nr:hypothetical protein [Gemmatimonadaceae bacterium]